MKLHPSLAAGIGALTLMSTLSVAQPYPNKAVRIVVPFPAGGAVDTTNRAIAQKLSEMWRQPVVIENRSGAGGNIGADAVAKSAPDGYTLLATTNALALSPALYRTLPFDVAKDFVPVVQTTSSYLVMVINPSLPVKTVNELIAYAKAKPGAISYGSTGIGVSPHLVTEQLKSRAGIDMLHVPYKGDAQAIPALLSGEVQLAFMPTSAVVAHIKSGKLRALAVTRLTRVPMLEGVPTVAESLPGFEFAGYQGLYAPAGTPAEAIGRIRRDVVVALAMPDLQSRLAAGGNEPPKTPPEQFSARFLQDIANFAQVVREAKIPQQE